MRSLLMYFEAMLPPPVLPQVPQQSSQPIKPVLQRLSPILINYMKKDPTFAQQVTDNIRNYENIAKLRARHAFK